jgi:hypothetical protein
VAGNGRKKRRTRENADYVLMLALAQGQTVHRAAKEAKIGERTAFRRLADPAFCERLAAMQGQLCQDALSHATGAANIATNRLLKQLGSSNTRALTQASMALIGAEGMNLDIKSLQIRVARLESLVKELHHDNR